MADNKRSFPFIAAKNWFALRRQFARTVPQQAGVSYVASVLNMSEESARANVVGSLKIVGLIDKDAKPTQLAYRWRDDEEYPKVCQEIREAIYPEELLAIAPDANTPQDRIERWFANTQGVGASAAQKYATFYLLLTSADLSKEAEFTVKTVVKRKQAKTIKSQPDGGSGKPSSVGVTKQLDVESLSIDTSSSLTTLKKHQPSLHIDIQIHISPEASADQIDQIFASMAKHLKL